MRYFSDVVADPYGNSQKSISITVKLNGSNATIYSDSAGNNATNPVTSDSSGIISFYYNQSGLYTFWNGSNQVGTTYLDYDTVSVKEFGAVGDWTTDDTAALVSAAASKIPVLLPPGKYKCTSALSPNSPWYGNYKGQGNPGSAFDSSTAPYTSEIYYTGAGWAVTTPYAFQDICIRGTTGTAGQNGLRITSGSGQRAGPCRILEMDGVGCEVGNTDANSGAYFTDTSMIEINNQARVGTCGFRVRGGGSASSNANVIKAPFIKGAWNRYAQLSGNANLVLGGDMEPAPTLVTSLGGSITEALYVDGCGNTWIKPYVEPTGGNPPKLIRFASTASGNEIQRIYSSGAGGNIFSLIEDLGLSNSVSLSALGENFTPSVGVAYSERNLIPNPGFVSASSSTVPYGWIAGGGSTGTFTVDTTTTRGGARTFKISTAGTRYQLDCYVGSTSSLATRNAISYTPLAALIGQTVSIGVWCQSSTAGVGALSVLSNTTSLGSASHSGSGNWEFLTVRTLIPAGATDVAIRLRNSLSFANTTGDCWFSEPVVVIGTDVPRFGGYKRLDSEDAASMGRLTWNPPITLTVNSATPDVSLGNFFKEANTGATTITNFLNGRLGQEIKILTTSANTTLKNNTTIVTTTGADKALSSGVVYKLIFSDDSKWHEY